MNCNKFEYFFNPNRLRCQTKVHNVQLLTVS